MSEQLPSYISQAGQAASQAAGVAGNTAAGVYTVGDLLQKKLTEAYGYNKDIINKLDAATQQYFSAPSEARVKFENIFNPFQRENLVSQYVGNQALPMLSQANVLGARMGGISDLVKSAVGGYQAMSAREQARADAAQKNYENIIQQYQLEQQLNATTTQEVEAGGRKYLITLDRKGNIIKKVDLGAASSASGAGDLAAALKALGIIPGGTTPTTTTPAQNNFWEDVPPVQVNFAPYFPSGEALGGTGVAQPTYNQPSQQQPTYKPTKSFNEIFG